MRRPMPPRPPRPKLPQTSRVSTIPASIGGWNARDPLAAMKPEDAIILDNLIPISGGVQLRKGEQLHVTGLGGPVETLMEYAPATGANKLLAATANKIYDVSTPSANLPSYFGDFTSGRWQHVMFSALGGTYLIICNGSDAVHHLQGAGIAVTAITGVEPKTLINVAVMVNRLWFVQKETLSAWYLPTGSIAGEAQEFPLGPMCRLGGELLACGSWTQDGGAGLDDLTVFVTTKGECIIYRGSDPTDINDWAQVGVFRIPEPIGRRCLIKIGPDLGVLTSQGLVTLAQVLSAAEGKQGKTAITDKISGAFTKAYSANGSSFGWQVVEYPREKLLLVNVPIEEGKVQHQYVMNTETGSWCRFTGLNGACWSRLGSDLYFGGNDGKIYRYSDDYRDLMNAIPATIFPAFNAFRTPQNKRFVAARPLFVGPTGLIPAIDLRVDYDTRPADSAIPASTTQNAVWDVATWDVDDWADPSIPRGTWQTILGIGQVGSLTMRVAVAQEFLLNQIDVMYEPGGFF